MNDDELAAALEGGNPDGGPADDLRALLADEATWAEPDPGGLDALLASIAAESGDPGRPAPRVEPVPEAGPPAAPAPVAPTPSPAPSPGPPPSPGPAHIRRERRGRPRRSLVLAAAAALVVLAGVAGAIVATRGGDDPAGTEVAIAGTELAPGASATAHVQETGSGLDITLDVRDLPPAEPGTYYQGWVRNADGQAVTIGTFHMRGGDDEVDLWAGVDLEDYPMLTVTLQQEGAGAESSGQVVLAGEIG